MKCDFCYHSFGKDVLTNIHFRENEEDLAERYNICVSCRAELFKETEDIIGIE